MPTIRARLGGQERTATVTINRPQPSAWPFSAAWPEPKMPTGLTVDTTGVYKPGRNNVEYRGGVMDEAIVEKNVVFRNVRFTWFQIAYPAENIWLIDCEIGPRANAIHPLIGSGFQANVAKNVVLVRPRVHGMHQGTITDHTEGLQVGGVRGLWIQGGDYYDNHVMDILFRSWNPAPIQYFAVDDAHLGVVRDASGGQSFYSILVAGVDNPNPSDGAIRRCRYESPFSIHPNAQRISAPTTGPDANVAVPISGVFTPATTAVGIPQRNVLGTVEDDNRRLIEYAERKRLERGHKTYRMTD